MPNDCTAPPDYGDAWMDSLRVVSGLPHYTTSMQSRNRDRTTGKAPLAKTAGLKSSSTPYPRPQTPRPPRQVTQKRTQGPQLTALSQQVCGLVDPFCSHAVGAKYPDDASGKTLPFTVRFLQTFASDANGNLGVIVAPQISVNPLVECSVTVGTNLMTAAPLTAPLVNTLAGYSKYRVVSCGIRVTNIAPILTAAGMLHFRSFNLDVGGPLGVVDGTSFAASQAMSKALIDTKDFCVILEHSSQRPEAFYFSTLTAPTNAITDEVLPGFNPVTILGQGLPVSTPCIQIEYLMHVEYTFEENAALGLATTHPPPANPLVTQVAAAITSRAHHVFSESLHAAGEYIQHRVLGLLSSALSARLGSVASVGLLTL